MKHSLLDIQRIMLPTECTGFSSKEDKFTYILIYLGFMGDRKPVKNSRNK